MASTKIRGRFLPSLVYNRWKWAVRLGLLLVPFLIFLAGGLILFLTPGKYRSTTLFNLENGPPTQEILELIESRGTLERVVDQLELGNRYNVDKETAMRIVHESSKVKIVPNTRLVEISVTVINKVDARDIAEQIPKSLKDYLVDVSEQKIAAKARQFRTLIQEASDVAGVKAAEVANLEKVHGANPADAAVMTTLQRARRTSMLADAEVERLQNLMSGFFTESIEAQPQLSIHSAPVISDSPHEPKVGDELDELTVRSLVAGLIAALLLPYLMELAFPPRRGRISEPDHLDDL